MIQSYFKIAVRNLIKDKTYTTINILGLSISLAVFFLMFLWVKDEYLTDKFHENGDRLFRVKRTIPLENDVWDVYNGAVYPLLEAAVEQLPEVEKYLAIGYSYEDNLKVDGKDYRAQGTFANADFFESLSFPVLQGDISQLDEKIESIAISERLAKRIFGQDWQEEAIGKMLEILDNGNFKIEAVYADFPSNSSIQNDFYYSLKKHLNNNQRLLSWESSGMHGALLLAEKADYKKVEAKLELIYQSNVSGEQKEGCILQNYEDHYLYGQFDEKAVVSGGRIEYVRTFSIAALLLLIISSINFVNLATVLATKRAREVGVRKVLGAHKEMLIGQFLMEAAILTFISVCLAMGTARLLLPLVNTLSNKMLSLDLGQGDFLLSILGVFLLTTLLTGAYPAFVMSSFKPINALKSLTKNRGAGSSFRKSLVVVQFALSLMLIVGAVVIQQQIHYIQTKNLGISKDNLLAIHQDEALTENFEVLNNELQDAAGIEGITLVGPTPLNLRASSSGVSWPGKRKDQENIEFSIVWTAQNFPEIFEIPLKEGAYYKEGQVLDTNYIVFNEKAIEIMGMEDPIGKSVNWWGKSRQIIGIVKDYHNQSLHQKITPTTFLLDANSAGWMFVKAEEGKIPEAIASLQTSFQKVLPDVPLHYEFLDEQYQELYAAERLTGTLANYFALISIFISCLGLFGLVTFIGQERSKEISIRKVLGASITSILALLSQDFLKLISLAMLIAFPIGWVLVGEWLQSFEYQISISLWVFALVGLGAVVITLLTISYQTIKVALLNPVDSLKTE